jgi:hypothetical protein
VRWVEELLSLLRMNLRDQPLYGNASVYDVTAHLRRSAAMRAVLSEKRRPARRRRMRAARARASTGRKLAACSRMLRSSASRVRWRRRARAFRAVRVEAGTLRTSTLGI